MTFEIENKKQNGIDFKRIYEIANELLATSRSITNFPYKAKKLLHERSDITLCTYEKAENKFNIPIVQFGSESAVLIEMNGANIIFYNQDEIECRVRFSIIHEYGHYILGHKMNLSVEDPLYGTQEIEANCFAAQMLMPEQLLRVCSYRGISITREFVIEAFGVSAEAAQRRINTLANTYSEWRSREEKEYDDIILLRFSNKLNQIAPDPKQYAFNIDEELAQEKERNRWLDRRSRRN